MNLKEMKVIISKSDVGPLECFSGLGRSQS